MSMMEIRLVRDMEKSKSRLYKAHGATLPVSTTDPLESVPQVKRTGGVEDRMNYKAGQMPVPDGDASIEPGAQLSPEQLQLLAEENQDMLKHYEDTLDQVR